MTAATSDARKSRSFGEEVVEGSYRGEFVVFDVEDGVELSDVEDVVDFLGEVEEFQFAAGVADGSEAADQLSNPGAVDVIDTDEVEDDLLLALGDEIADGIAEIADFFAEDDATVNVEDGNVSNFASVNLQRHDSWRSKADGRNGSGCGGASQWE
jgi:hypothetical protein